MSLPSQQEAMERANRGRRLLRGAGPPGTTKASYYILGTFNVSMLEPLLVEALDRIGIPAHAKSGPFGQLEEEILNDASALYAAAARRRGARAQRRGSTGPPVCPTSVISR